LEAKKNNTFHRIESIDILRGITILVMIFVNDLAGVASAPAWMKHNTPGTGGMTFVDLVFPAFLFIVGMSIPFAIDKRLADGYSIWQVWKHILVRVLGLLIIGVFMVNSYSISKVGFLNADVWILFMYTGVILTWNQPAQKATIPTRIFTIKRVIGIVILLISLFLYSGNNLDGLIQMRTQWWGILGLIGWAYLVASAAYILIKNNLAGLIGVIAILFVFYISVEIVGVPFLNWFNSYLVVSQALGSLAAISVSGVVLGVILKPDSYVTLPQRRIRWAFLYGLGFIITALLLNRLDEIHKVFIVDKNWATVPWCLLSSGLTAWIWVVIYWIVDIKGLKGWTGILRTAGNNALFAYVLAHAIGSIIMLTPYIFGGFNFYIELGNHFVTGLIRATLFAFFMVWLAGKLHKMGIWLKL
jgi:predicted acyltransferase